MDATVTYKQFCELLTHVVSMRGEEFVFAWKELAEAALSSNEPMQRDDVLLAMFEASMVMGIDRDERQLDENCVQMADRALKMPKPAYVYDRDTDKKIAALCLKAAKSRARGKRG